MSNKTDAFKMMKYYQRQLIMFLVCLILFVYPSEKIVAENGNAYDVEDDYFVVDMQYNSGTKNIINPDDTKKCDHFDNDSKVSKSYYGKEVFANNPSYCYQYLEVTRYTCNQCNESWEHQTCAFTVPHSCVEVLDHYDDTYAWYYKECQKNGCGFKIYSRKEPHGGYIPVTPTNRAIQVRREDSFD